MTETPPLSVPLPRSSDIILGKSLSQLGIYGEGTRRWKEAVERQTLLHLAWVDGIYETIKSELGSRQWIISGDDDNGSNWISILNDADRCRHTRLEFASILECQSNAGNTAMPQHSTESIITPTEEDVCFDFPYWNGTSKYRDVIKSLVSTSNTPIWSDALNNILQQSIKGRFLLFADKVWRLANEEEIYEKAAPCYKRYQKLDNPAERGGTKKARTSSSPDKKQPARKTRGLRNKVKIDKLTETYVSELKVLKAACSLSNEPEVHDEGTKILNLIMQVQQARVEHDI
jgi:hypothetical protein